MCYRQGGRGYEGFVMVVYCGRTGGDTYVLSCRSWMYVVGIVDLWILVLEVRL